MRLVLAVGDGEPSDLDGNPLQIGEQFLLRYRDTLVWRNSKRGLSGGSFMADH